MNLKRVFHESLSDVKCDISGHVVDEKALKDAFSGSAWDEKFDADCKKCDMPLHVRIDKGKKSYYISEQY